MSQTLVIFGAPDVESTAAKKLAWEAGYLVADAIAGNGMPVHPGNTYASIGYRIDGSYVLSLSTRWNGRCILFECGGDLPPDAERCDHHRPGDPGYGRPPEEYLAASSIGQLMALLGPTGWAAQRRIMGGASLHEAAQEINKIAAADHCLEAAYRGRCPGVDPDALMAWRVRQKAAFRRLSCRICGGTGIVPSSKTAADILGFPPVIGSSEAEELVGHCRETCPNCTKLAVMTDVEEARRQLRMAIRPGATDCGHGDYKEVGCAGCGLWSPPAGIFADLRGRYILELPEAAAREGIPFLADQTDRDGRKKVVLMAAPPDLVREFMEGRIVSGLTGHYGDPARGFAGGYY